MLGIAAVHRDASPNPARRPREQLVSGGAGGKPMFIEKVPPRHGRRGVTADQCHPFRTRPAPAALFVETEVKTRSSGQLFERTRPARADALTPSRLLRSTPFGNSSRQLPEIMPSMHDLRSSNWQCRSGEHARLRSLFSVTFVWGYLKYGPRTLQVEYSVSHRYLHVAAPPSSRERAERAVVQWRPPTNSGYSRCLKHWRYIIGASASPVRRQRFPRPSIASMVPTIETGRQNDLSGYFVHVPRRHDAARVPHARRPVQNSRRFLIANRKTAADAAAHGCFDSLNI